MTLPPVSPRPDQESWPAETQWRIQSGELGCVAAGETPIVAFIAAVREHHPKSLGQIFSALRVGETDEDEERYALTYDILKNAGMAE